MGSERRRRALALLLAGLLLAGCETVSYLGQAAVGQARLLAARRPLEQVIADPGTDAVVRDKLLLIRDIRAFAARELAMEGLRGFDSYAATGRSHVVWNVVAAPEFSLEPLSWCFPVAGCVSYRGYFSREGADRYAASLARKGHDTVVYGVAAYSTLGWFDDPVLDTWARRGDRALAALVFHEYAHQLLYVPGDTALSEGFAQVVEREGLRRWLQARNRAGEFAAWERERAVDAAFDALLARTRDRLSALYAEPLTAVEMRERKRTLFDGLRAEYAREREAWPADYRFDGWMAGPLNNARLAGSANYQSRVPAMQALLAQAGGELPAFYAAARALAALPATERAARLAALEGGR